MKKLLIFLLLIIAVNAYSQQLVGVYNLPAYLNMNNVWGFTTAGDTLFRIGSDNDGKIYKMTKTGIILDSLSIPYAFNHGMAWDGTGLWIAEDYRSGGARFYKISLTGQRLDSITNLSSNQAGVGGLAIDGNNLWFSVYYPDFTTYPYAYAYKINLTSKQITDTIPLRGRQVYGIAVKGDTIFYVNNNFQSEPERIYAYRKAVGDTLFSFPAPDPDNNCDPKGLFWDGQNLYLNAYNVGANLNRCIYKYALSSQGNPIISTSSSVVDFGNVVVGTTGTQVLNVSNIGTAMLIITGKSMTNPLFGINPSSVPDTILPGANKNYNITFTPQTSDSVAGLLNIASNDQATPVKTVTVRGRGIYNGAYIVSSDSIYSWSPRRVNSSSGYKFIITNTGNANLNITSMNFGGARFKLDTVQLTFPVSIPPQTSKAFRVWFNPIAASTYSDTLKINSNAVNKPVYKFALGGSGSTINPVLGNILWEGVTPLNPYISANDIQPTSIKQIGDVNGDGVNDVLVASNNYLVTCYSGNSSVTADSLWSFNTGVDNNHTGPVMWKDCMFPRTDVDGDGVPDVVFGCGGGNEMVYTVSGRTGNLIWAYGDPSGSSNGDIYGIRVDKDYNGDGVNDVLVSASGNGQNGGGRHAIICLNGLTGQVIFYNQLSNDFTYDVVNTQYGAAIGMGYNGGPYSVQSVNNLGSGTWNYSNVTSAVWSMYQVPSIDNDTNKEIIGLWGFNGGLFCVSAADGSVKWTKSLGTSNNGTILLLDDLDSNGFIDFTVSGPQTVYRIDSKTNNILWQYTPIASFIRDIDLLTDVNGDGRQDIAVVMQQPALTLVLDGATGQQLFQYSFGTGIAERADRITKLNSIDGNSTSEFVAGNREGRIVCFDGGPNIHTGITPITSVVPDKYSLAQNYPNPFNPSTKIKFSIPQNSEVKIRIFDILGKEVQSLVNSRLNAGTYEVNFNASKLSSGVYFYKLEAGTFSDIKRMVLVK